MPTSVFFALLITTLTLISSFNIASAQQSRPSEQCQIEQTDCSVPYFGQVVGGPTIIAANKFFAKACVRHDGCYRYGNRTYGLTKKQCDDQFNREMKNACSNIPFLVDVGSFGATQALCRSHAKTYYEAVRRLGGDSYKTNRSSKFCRYDRRNENAHFHQVNPNGKLQALQQSGSIHLWSKGWTTVESFSTNRGTFVFLLKSNNGLVHIHRLNPDGGLGPRVAKYDWSAGWSKAEFYSVSDRNYLFLLKGDTGAVHIHPINSNGSVGKRIIQYDWSSGWTSVEFFSQNGKSYLLLQKSVPGTVHIHQMSNDGTVGRRVYTGDWGNYWSNIRFFTVKGELFVFLLKQTDGAVRVHKINNNATIGGLVKQYNWSPGWSNSEIFTTSEGSFLFLLKASNGRVHLHKMNENGSVGLQIGKEKWSKGWTRATFIEHSGKTAVLLTKSGVGR